MALANDTFVSAAATASSFLKQFLNHEVTFRYGERNISVQYAYAIAVAVGVVSLSKLYSSVVSSIDQGIPHKAGYPIVGSWAFFTQRHNFVDEGIKKFGNIFSFKILNVSSFYSGDELMLTTSAAANHVTCSMRSWLCMVKMQGRCSSARKILVSRKDTMCSSEG